MATATDDIRIHTIWQWCCSAYLQHGSRRLAFPKDTDPTKTYQWRYMQALDRKFKEWGFDDRLCRDFIDIAVVYAKQNKLLTKGPSIFMQNNLVEVCYAELQKRQRGAESALEIIKRAAAWLRDQTGDKRPLDVLLRCDSLGAYPNVIKWYQSGHLPEQFLALSQACGLAMAALAKSKPKDRALLPATGRLFILRMTLLNDNAIKFQARQILRDDWRKSV